MFFFVVFFCFFITSEYLHFNFPINFQVNTCVYLNKKIEFCGNYLRCQVCEMWSSGERVACGVINENTKVSCSYKFSAALSSAEKWSALEDHFYKTVLYTLSL